MGEAMERSVRWLDRCIAQHEKSGKSDVQNLFAIVQGGLDPELRDRCLDEMVKRKDGVAGFAIGGLSGGEEKGLLLSKPSRFIYAESTATPQMCSGGCENRLSSNNTVVTYPSRF